MKTRVFIPFKETDEWRKKALRYVIDHWAYMKFDVSIQHETGNSWSKGRILAELVNAHPGAENLIIADADCIVQEEMLRETIQAVSRTQTWGTPYRKVHRLTLEATGKVYAGRGLDIMDTLLAPYPAVFGGGVTVIHRTAWETVQGIDPRFVGWGGEDIAFGWALDTLVKQHHAADGAVFHLWHPVQGPRQPVSRSNSRLLARYRRARGRSDRMSVLVDEIRVLSKS